MSPSRRTQSAREELVAIQRELFRRNQRQIESSVARPPRYLAEYEAEVARRTKGFEDTISPEALVTEAALRDIVFIGDFHTLRTAQKTFVHLAEELLERAGLDRPGPDGADRLLPAFALELVESEQQPALDTYLAGRWTQKKEKRFLERIVGPDHWVEGNWDNYKPILEFARQHEIPVLGIEGRGGTRVRARADSLIRRDEHMAERIVEFLAEYPERPLLVLVGELHVAPPHLPACIRAAAKARGLPAPRHLVLYQNREEIHWNLVEQGRADAVDVVRIRKDEYCSVNTPPHIVQQSYLNWLEADDTLIDSPRPAEKFEELARMIAAFLEIDVGDGLESVEVFSAHDLSFLPRLRRSKDFSDHDIELIRSQVLASESYTIPAAGVVYLAKLSLNHIAEEASHFLHFVCAGASREPADLIDSFYARCLEEALGFFGSKVINPKRRCDHRRDFAEDVDRFRDQGITAIDGEGYRLARFVLEHKGLERGKVKKDDPWLKVIYAQDHEMFHRVTHALGYILGDRLFWGLKRDRISKNEIRELFHESFDADEAPLLTYFTLAKRLASVRIPRRL